MPLYTPFFERATAKVTDAMRQRDIGQAARSAYMGAPGAMGNLYSQAPELAGQMERTTMQREQIQAQTQAAQTAAARQASQDAAKEQDRVSALQKELSPKAAEFDNFEDFNDFIENQALARGIPNVDRIDQANFDLLKEAYPDEDASNQRRQKIDALTKMYGDAISNPREVATKMVDGIIDIEFLEDGTVMMTDKSLLATDPSKAVTYLPVGDLTEGAERAKPEQGQTLYELAGTVGGITGGIKQLLSGVAGQFGWGVFPEEMEAYQTLNTAMGDMTRSLMVGDRWTVGQANMLREELDIKAGVFSTAPQTQNRMRSIDRSLKFRLEQFERDSEDRTLSQQDRSMQRANAATVRNFVDLLGVPEKLDVSLFTMDTVSEMQIDDINQFINNATREELNSLPKQVAEALAERRNRGR